MKYAGLWMVVVFCLLVVTVGVVIAQDDDTCPVIVQEALDAVDDLCALTGRNEACYGNLTLNATAREGVSDFTFEVPGDVVSVGDVQSFQLQPMDIDAGTWGVALLRVQANIPDTLPGQNVTFLLFGNVEFVPVDPANVVSIMTNGSLNVRSGPGLNFAVITTLDVGETLQASGQNSTGEWLLIALPGGGSGWVFADLVTVDGDASGLEVVADDAGITQAFFFRSGIGDAPCEAAPDSGLLLHTPDGVGEVELLINEVRFSIGSTVYVQAEPGGDMVVAVLEGEVTVFVDGVSVIIHAGEYVTIPLDADGHPIGPPSAPMPFDPDRFEVLPVTLVSRDMGYVGTWRSTDIDASNQTLRIWLDSGNYQIEWFDDAASVCGVDGAGDPIYPATLTGTGSVLGTGGLSLNITGACDDGAGTVVGPFVVPFIYDPVTDTLDDGTLTWTRVSP